MEASIRWQSWPAMQRQRQMQADATANPFLRFPSARLLALGCHFTGMPTSNFVYFLYRRRCRIVYDPSHLISSHPISSPSHLESINKRSEARRRQISPDSPLIAISRRYCTLASARLQPLAHPSAFWLRYHSTLPLPH